MMLAASDGDSKLPKAPPKSFSRRLCMSEGPRLVHLYAGEGLLEGASLAAADEEAHEVVPAPVNLDAVTVNKRES